MTITAGREMHQAMHPRNTHTKPTQQRQTPAPNSTAAGRALYDNRGRRPAYDD